MIEEIKDKKDDVVDQIMDLEKKGNEQTRKTDKAEQDKSEKDQKVAEQKKEKAGNNAANALKPIADAKVTADKTEVRAEREQHGNVLGYVRENQKVEILEHKGDELKIILDGKVGYIPASVTDYASKTGKKKEATGETSVVSPLLSVRMTPDKDGVVLGELRQGDRVKYYEEKDGYLEVHIGDQIGYIKAENTAMAAKTGKNHKIDEKALRSAPEDLRVLLEKEDLTATEIATARDLMKTVPESVQPALFEALQMKPSFAREDMKKPATSAGFTQLAASLEMLGIQNPSSEMPFASYLEQLKHDQRLPDNGGMANWGSLANAMGVSYSILCQMGDTSSSEKKFWSEKAKEQLRLGHAVMASINHQAVRIEAVEDKGLVITVPEVDNGEVTHLGCWQNYTGKSAVEGHGKKGLIAFDALKNAGMDWVITLG